MRELVAPINCAETFFAAVREREILRGYGGGCLAILGFEGEAPEVSERRARALAIVRRAGGLRVGREADEGDHS